MQTKRILWVYFLLFSTAYLIQAQPCIADLNRGLVAYYPFTGNARDSSGNNNHGTINGAILVADRFGRTNSAFQFNENQTITVPDVDILDGMTLGLTISFWVKQPPITSWTNFYITKATHCLTTGDDAYSVRSKQNGQIWAQLPDVNDNDNYQISNKSISDNTWHHIVVVWNKPNSLIYIDGVADIAGSYTRFSANIDNSPEVLAFGHYINGACTEGFAYGETLDDIRIYNRALATCEILDLYNREKLPPTSNKEIENNLFTISPNPTNLQLSISFLNTGGEISELKISNLTGQILLNLSFVV